MGKWYSLGMKKTKKFLISSLILSFFLVSCAQAAPFSSPSVPVATSSQSNESSLSSSAEASVSLSGGSTSVSISSESVPSPANFEIYCVNDFHGAVNESDGRYYEAGIKKYFGYLEQKKNEDPEHTIVISAGDMFQGSFESNFNFGQLVTEAMNAVPFDAMVLGNHEFDYGRDKLTAIQDTAEFPLLAGNIYRCVDAVPVEPIEDFAPYTIIERGGYKIGIVGMIGEGQTSSITSRHVSDVKFVDPENLALQASKTLKEEKGCDAVILTIHDDAENVASWASASKLNQYFDGLFCGHSHTQNKRSIGGLTALQAYCNGEAYSHLTISVSSTGVKQVKAAIESASPSFQESEKISGICDKYFQKEEYATKANATAGTLNSNLTAYTVSDLACVAIYEKAVADYPDLLLAMQNKQRASVSRGQVTYRDLYKALPFTNIVYVVEVPAEDIIREAAYNETYSGPNAPASLESGKTYKIAVIDYLLFHQNDRKEYDYFPSMGSGQGEVLRFYEEIPVDITFSYIKNTLQGTIDAGKYDGSRSRGFNLYRPS